MADWSKAPQPKKGKLEDRTGIPKTGELLEQMLHDLLLRYGTRPGTLLLDDDHRPMYVDPILNIAHDPYKWQTQAKAKEKK